MDQMGKSLVIVESPTKARTLSRILGDEVNIVASIGHIRDLPEKRLGIDIKNGFEPQYEISSQRKDVMAELTKAVKSADSVYLATDPDREGEAIAWHLFEVLKDCKQDLEFLRVTFHEITRKAVNHAFDSPHKLNMNLVNAQQARRVLDRIVGYQVSPLLWNRVERGTSAGRVQSVALRLICERQVEIDVFKPKEYWNLLASFTKNGETEAAAAEPFVAKLHRLNGEKVDITNSEQAEAYTGDAAGATYQVADVSKTPRKRHASPPFITSTLQQAASSNLRFSTDQIMRLAQQLYEGVDTGSGPSGLITYMRTDSFNVASEARESTRTYISETFGAEFIPQKPNTFKARKSAQEAHEAIRPTDVNLTPEAAKPFLDDRQHKLYTLIWNRFVASQMSPAETNLYAIELENEKGSANHIYRFRASVTTVTFQGFMRVYNLKDIEGDADEEVKQTLPELAQGTGCNLQELEREQKFTEPPPAYSEASLVRALEANGIGRPSTYAGIVRTIQKRTYVNREKGKLVPTDLGKTVNAYLVDKMPKLFEVAFTARMEDELDTIEQGSLNWYQMIENFYGDFSEWLTEAKLGESADSEAVGRLLGAFSDSIDWHPAEKVGRRTYDDKKFYTSLKRQLDNGKVFSDKQWKALLILVLRYEKQLADLPAMISELDIGGVIDELRQELHEREQKRAAQKPDDNTLRIYRCLDQVGEWDAPVQRGKRTYDDRQFYQSLVEQVEAGKTLSDAQLNALKRLIIKYRTQLADYDDLQAALELPSQAELDKTRAQLKILLGLAAEIGEFAPPTGKGKRRFDEREFVSSLAEQFEQGAQLTNPQVSALKRLLVKHKKKIENFDDRVAGIELQPPHKKTDVDCPRCGNGKLCERPGRGGATFFGCETYPKCKYHVTSLDDVGGEE
ncbi:MAG TPA: type I DNA topoisomerase [Lentisphaeria bacterium]|nr:type I DNA topoisomerase [Lentisphaeria bacterium]|tara:strand:+ start:2672 stop:5392 length:2721 start_codon:yes stop_codon:yes gene_type:complete